MSETWDTDAEVAGARERVHVFIDALCRLELTAIRGQLRAAQLFVNRSAGQHLRAVRARAQPPAVTVVSGFTEEELGAFGAYALEAFLEQERRERRAL